MDQQKKLTPLRELDIESDTSGWQVGDGYTSTYVAFEWKIPIDDYEKLPDKAKAKMIAYLNVTSKMRKYEEQLQARISDEKDHKIRFTPGKSFKPKGR